MLQLSSGLSVPRVLPSVIPEATRVWPHGTSHSPLLSAALGTGLLNTRPLGRMIKELESHFPAPRSPPFT